MGLWNVLLPTRERVIRKGDVRVVFVIPRLAMPWGPVWRAKARQKVAGQAKHACLLAEGKDSMPP